MAQNFSQVLLAGLVLAFSALPAPAQEAAYDDGPHAVTSNAGMMGHSAPQQAATRPQQTVSTSAAADNHSNLRHWSRFSSSSSSSLFVRVAPGTKVKGASEVSHYIRPTCVAPGKAAAIQQNQSGPVKRYLAYNVPLSNNVKPRPNVAQVVVGSSTKKVSAKKPTHIQVLGYGDQRVIGTYIVNHHARPSGPAISCYASYH